MLRTFARFRNHSRRSVSDSMGLAVPARSVPAVPIALTGDRYMLYHIVMTAAPHTYRGVIERWPSLAVFADDIGVPYGTAKQMRRRDSIPAEYWVRIAAKASQRKIRGITIELLASLRAQSPARERAQA